MFVSGISAMQKSGGERGVALKLVSFDADIVRMSHHITTV